MKKIYLGLFLVLVFLSQVSLRANADQASEDQASVAFFQAQAQERAVFIQQHQDLIAKLDAQGKAIMAQKNGTSHHPGFLTANSIASTQGSVSSDDNAALSTFIQKQQSEKAAFIGNHFQGIQNNANNQFNPIKQINPITPINTIVPVNPIVQNPPVVQNNQVNQRNHIRQFNPIVPTAPSAPTVPGAIVPSVPTQNNGSVHNRQFHHDKGNNSTTPPAASTTTS